MRTDVLILTAPFGGGHTMAAQAVAQALTADRPGLRALVVDVAADSRRLQLTARTYLGLLRWAPSLYRALYSGTSRDQGRTARLVARQLEGTVRQLLLKHQPRLIVCTHPFPAAAVARLRVSGECTTPVSSVVTDFVAHPLWVQSGIDRYFAATPLAAETLRAAGADSIQIAVTGLPIRAGFAPASASAPVPGRRVLVLGGSLGLGPMAEVTSLLAGAGLDVTVVCGRNDALRQSLAAQAPAAVRVLGYTPDIAGLMRSADVLVTKPGGLTCSEALAVGMPMVLMGALPGHEEENAQALAAAGVARVAGAPVGVVAHVQALLLQKSAWAAMRRLCLAQGRPDAAAAVAAELLVLLERFQHVA